MSSKAVEKRPCRMAASEAEPEALTERVDIARGLENLPVSVWPPGAEPEPFEVGKWRAGPTSSCRGRGLTATSSARAATGARLGPVQV